MIDYSDYKQLEALEQKEYVARKVRPPKEGERKHLKKRKRRSYKV